jgi:hypothetical protein
MESPNFETEQLAIYLNRKEKRDLAIVKLFVENGADLEYPRILSNVCGHGHTEIFDYILKNCVKKGGISDDINFLNSFLDETDPDEYRPVLRAFDNKHFDLFKTLINLGASFSFNDNYIAKRVIHQDPKILEFLHTKGLDLSFDDNYLLFHYVQNNAFTHQMILIVDYLLANGADLNGRNHTILSHVSSMVLLDHLTDNYADRFSKESIEKTIDIYYMNGYEKNFIDEIHRLMNKSNYKDSLLEILKSKLPQYFRNFLENRCYTFKLKPEEIRTIIDLCYLNNSFSVNVSDILNIEGHDYDIPDYAIDRIIYTVPVKWPVKSLYKAWIKDRVNKDVELGYFQSAFKLRENI